MINQKMCSHHKGAVIIYGWAVFLGKGGGLRVECSEIRRGQHLSAHKLGEGIISVRKN